MSERNDVDQDLVREATGIGTTAGGGGAGTGVDAEGGQMGGGETAARGYGHTPGNETGTEGTVLDQDAGGVAGTAGNTAGAGGLGNPAGTHVGGTDAGAEDAFGAEPGARERFDASDAYAGSDIDPSEVGGLDPAAGGIGAGPGSGSGERGD